MKNNQLEISDDTKLAYIQQRFNQLFPFLWLEFYNKDADDSLPSTNKIKLVDGKTVGQIRAGHQIAIVTLFPEMSVADLENIFCQTLGVSIQVLRKSGNIWMETPQTDSWSLEQQNRQGEAISSFISKQEKKRKRQ